MTVQPVTVTIAGVSVTVNATVNVAGASLGVWSVVAPGTQVNPQFAPTNGADNGVTFYRNSVLNRTDLTPNPYEFWPPVNLVNGDVLRAEWRQGGVLKVSQHVVGGGAPPPPPPPPPPPWAGSFPRTAGEVGATGSTTIGAIVVNAGQSFTYDNVTTSGVNVKAGGTLVLTNSTVTGSVVVMPTPGTVTSLTMHSCRVMTGLSINPFDPATGSQWWGALNGNTFDVRRCWIEHPVGIPNPDPALNPHVEAFAMFGRASGLQLRSSTLYQHGPQNGTVTGSVNAHSLGGVIIDCWFRSPNTCQLSTEAANPTTLHDSIIDDPGGVTNTPGWMRPIPVNCWTTAGAQVT